MSKNVLIVEDNVIAMSIEKALIEGLGFHVDSAETGEIAVEFAQKNQYDIILMDLGLPGIDGIEATRRIRQNEKEMNRNITNIVAVTANSDLEQHKICLEAGMGAVFGKPFTVKIAQSILSKVN